MISTKFPRRLSQVTRLPALDVTGFAFDVTSFASGNFGLNDDAEA